MAGSLNKLILSLMLFYHGRGRRDYQREPVPLRRRLHWECAAILAGHAAPALGSASQWREAQGPSGIAELYSAHENRAREAGHPLPGSLASRHCSGSTSDSALPETPALWLFPPRHLHGWRSAHPRGCRVCILHLTGMPRLLADAAASAGYLHLPLDAAGRRIIEGLDRRIAALLAARPEASEIAAELARGELGALLCPHLPARASSGGADAAHVLKRALAWLDDHLHEEGVGIEQAARAVAISPAQLRRIAHAVAGRSPRDLLRQLRLERARDLLRQTDDGLAAIAWACGYADEVALSNAFLRHHGQRPGRWRESAGRHEFKPAVD